MPLSEIGQVLGIDVGYSGSGKTTGFCVLSWNNQEVDWRSQNTGTDGESRIQAVQNLLPSVPRNVLAVAIDGPLRPKLIVDSSTFRSCESLLSRGQFQKRGKPGPTNGGSGPQRVLRLTDLLLLAQSVMGTSSCRPLIIGDKVWLSQKLGLSENFVLILNRWLAGFRGR